SFYNEDNDFAAVLKEYFKLGFNSRYVISTPFAQPRLFAEAGYSPAEVFYTDGCHRGIYDNVSNEDLLRFACYEHHQGDSKKIVRAFLLSRD
ncbi:MAG: hypothetical protein U9P14_04490, partial [Gemmatimonadota bacterium]|nr:hypothetical protein [Gemmatimonadota bacterium]